MGQKVVEMLSFELKNFRIIRAVKLDFQKWKNVGVIEVIGDMGQGKSSALEGLEMAIAGTSKIKDKSLLDLGFKAEALLVDGTHKIYLAIKVSELSRGINKGDKKFESIIYEKDVDGKIITNPVIDGKKATAGEYTKMLSTALTFRMDDLFSENQTTHRKLIEDLFSKELFDLGVDEIVKSILVLKAIRDNLRHDRDRLAATMEAFKEMGLDEESLKKLTKKPTEKLTAKIKDLEVQKGVLLSNIEQTRTNELLEIEGRGREVVKKIRKLNEEKLEMYDKAKVAYDDLKLNYMTESHNLTETQNSLTLCDIPPKWNKDFLNIFDEWDTEIKLNNKQFLALPEPITPKIIPIVDDKFTIPEAYHEDFGEWVGLYLKIVEEYKLLLNSPLTEPDTSEIEKSIASINSHIAIRDNNNELFARYSKWKEWITACGEYDKEVDNLRKLYTKIPTGVDGLSIVPLFTEAGRLEIWMEYNGSHDIELFKNASHTSRRLYEYSKSQRAIVGVLLQASRLDKKDKALRLAVLDDYTQTRKGKELLEKICQEKNLKLVIAKTSDEYDKGKLDLGQMVMENGEILFE